MLQTPAPSQVAHATGSNGASSPPASSASQAGNNQAGNNQTGNNQTGNNQKHSSEYTIADRVRIWITGYWASFMLTGVMIPIVSSAIVVTLYFSFPGLVTLIPFIKLDPAWSILFFAHVITIMLWLIVALVCYPFASASSANSGSYGLLKACLCHLRAKLGIDGHDHDLEMIVGKCGDLQDAINQIRDINDKHRNDIGNNCNQDNCNQEARKTALASFIDVRKVLYYSPTGLLWAFGSGYCNAWRLIHQAEEAIIEFDCPEEVIYGALKDKMALEGSAISSKDELLNSLIQAVIVLQPKAEIYFNEQPNKNSGVLAIPSKPAIPFKQVDPSEEATARSVLRRVRRVLNNLQDRSWEGLLRSRNRLLSSIAVTGLATHILLCITVLTIPISTTSNNYMAPLVAATAFYLVGAVTGLFGRFYQESTAGSSVDDFGFSTTRLIATPLLSGLAAIGGVLLIALGGSLSSANESLVLGKIFVVNPQFLLIAAVFGLTPNLLITGLQNTAKQYESDIQSSRVVTPSTANKKG